MKTHKKNKKHDTNTKKKQKKKHTHKKHTQKNTPKNKKHTEDTQTRIIIRRRITNIENNKNTMYARMRKIIKTYRIRNIIKLITMNKKKKNNSNTKIINTTKTQMIIRRRNRCRMRKYN